MAEVQMFHRGDTVVHPRRPEWGAGTVETATPLTHNGQSAQKLVVRFKSAGRKTINTALAPLVAPEHHPGPVKPSSSKSSSRRSAAQAGSARPHDLGSTATAEKAANDSSGSGGWLASLENRNKTNAQNLGELPEGMTDPFSSDRQRLKVILESYRFDPDAATAQTMRNPRYRPNPFDSRYVASGKRLTEWAIAQTGLEDPLSDYSRHEIEEAYARFSQARDQALKELIQQMRKTQPQSTLEQAAVDVRTDAAKAAMKWALTTTY